MLFSCAFYEIFKNIFSYRTPPVAASEIKIVCRNTREIQLKAIYKLTVMTLQKLSKPGGFHYNQLTTEQLLLNFPICNHQNKALPQVRIDSAILVFTRSHSEVFFKKSVLKIFAKFIGKHLHQSLFFNNVATLLKKRLWLRIFSCEFCKFI